MDPHVGEGLIPGEPFLRPEESWIATVAPDTARAAVEPVDEDQIGDNRLFRTRLVERRKPLGTPWVLMVFARVAVESPREQRPC